MKDGHLYREHLEAAAKSAGPAGRIAAAELAGPEFPEACAYVWTWFCELAVARRFDDGMPQPIGHAELQAWAQFTRRMPNAWEVDLLRALDLAWLSTKDEDRKGGA